LYKLAYLPGAEKDITDIFQYIAVNLHNPPAAKNLAFLLKKSIENLQAFPYSHQVCLSIRSPQIDFRRIPVKNYAVFYWVDEPTRTVHIARVIYAKRNHKRLLKGIIKDTKND